LATNLTALLHFASRIARNGFRAGFRGAAFDGFARHGVALNALRLKHVSQAVEQITHRGNPALFASATIGLSAGSGLCTGSYLGAGITGGDLGASVALAAATAVQPEHAIQEFKTEPLAAHGHAHQERSKNRFASH
jgi:hypothetical protein